jgi:hypothetical protein
VIGDDAHGHISGIGKVFLEISASEGTSVIAKARKLFAAGNNSTEQISVVVGTKIIDHRGRAFQSHSGINGGAGKRRDTAISRSVKLHKDEIPNLKKIPVIFHQTLSAWAGLTSTIEMNFTARTTGARLSHGPEVLGFAKTNNLIA